MIRRIYFIVINDTDFRNRMKYLGKFNDQRPKIMEVFAIQVNNMQLRYGILKKINGQLMVLAEYFLEKEILINFGKNGLMHIQSVVMVGVGLKFKYFID